MRRFYLIVGTAALLACFVLAGVASWHGFAILGGERDPEAVAMCAAATALWVLHMNIVKTCDRSLEVK